MCLLRIRGKLPIDMAWFGMHTRQKAELESSKCPRIKFFARVEKIAPLLCSGRGGLAATMKDERLETNYSSDYANARILCNYKHVTSLFLACCFERWKTKYEENNEKKKKNDMRLIIGS